MAEVFAGVDGMAVLSCSAEGWGVNSDFAWFEW